MRYNESRSKIMFIVGFMYQSDDEDQSDDEAQGTDDLDCATFSDKDPGFVANGGGNVTHDPGKDSHENSLEGGQQDHGAQQLCEDYDCTGEESKEFQMALLKFMESQGGQIMLGTAPQSQRERKVRALLRHINR